ncbi:MAG: hypothetical protein WBB45_06870 [Cyclobacteriaceae bacterium]
MNRRRYLAGTFIYIIACSALSSCEVPEEVFPTEPPEPALPVVKDKGTRGLSIVGSTIDLPGIEDIEASIQAGANEGQIVLDWEKLDDGGNIRYDLLDTAINAYADNNLPLTLVFNPISRNRVSVPADLADKAWSDETLRTRFDALLYGIYYRYPTVNVNRVIIGEEVDIYLKEDAAAWDAYTAFFTFAKDKLHSYYGNSVKAGVSTSFASLNLLETKDLAMNLQREADMFSISYFPRNRDYTFRNIIHIVRDFEYMKAISGSRKIFLQECGYPSAISCNSSVELQRQFIAEIFRGWDMYDNTFEGIHFTWLRDKSDAEVARILEESGMIESVYLSRFTDFLRTSGLQRTSTQKPAIQQLKVEADARGW